MAQRGKNTRQASRKKSAKAASGQSVEVARRGIRSTEDYRDLMCALMGDVIQGNVNPDVANAACNAGRNLIRIVELEYKMSATSVRGAASRVLPLTRRIAVVGNGNGAKAKVG